MKAFGYNSKTSWIALGACVVLEFLTPLLMRLAGVFYVIILDNYKVDRELAVVPIVTYGVVRTVSGPLVGFLGEVFGLKTIILIGSILQASGIGISYFANDIVFLIISLGIIYGTGYAFINSLVSSVISQHFNKNMSLTNGIVFTGGLVGAIVMTPVIHYLNNSYGTSGMFLILSGFFLHSIPAVILLRDPKNENHESKRSNNNESINNRNVVEIINEKHYSSFKKENESETKHLQQDECVCRDNHQILSYEKNIEFKENEENCYVIKVLENETIVLNELFVQREENKSKFTFVVTGKETKIKNNNDIVLVKYSKIDKNGLQDGIYNIESNYFEIVFNGQNINSSVKKSNYKEKFHIFCDPAFDLQMIIHSSQLFCSTLVWTVVIDYARDKGISTENALYFVMSSYVSQIFGNLTLNWITDHAFMTRVNFNMICFLVLSLDAGFLVWSHSFSLMISGYIIFGFLSGAIASSLPGMMVDSIEKNQQNMALASRFTFYGILCPLKSPIIGYFRGHLGSYDWVHYLIMGLLFSCGLLVKLTPIFTKCRQNRA